jgi:hypothetical protein
MALCLSFAKTRSLLNQAKESMLLALRGPFPRIYQKYFRMIGRVDVQGPRTNLYRKDGITVKRLIGLLLICGFLSVLVGCSDTTTKAGGASGVTKTTESKKTEE